MSNKIGRFEIISELSHSDAISVYKATDPENGQTVALKVLKLEALGDQAKSLVELLQKEVESCKTLQSPNIAVLTATEEADNSFVAAMEYVQGNSVATTLARKEGFSIWDLLDIARQTRQGLDYAHEQKVVHYSLEPAKIMVTWDGTVKLLSFGISQMSAVSAQAKGQPSSSLYYMSPEQLRGDPVDSRSNLFSMGAIFYEMITECKAFQGEDADQVRQQILESTPTPPHQINKKISPALSEVILKALAKDPAERYQTGQALVEDLEKCKNAPAKSVGPVPTAKVTPQTIEKKLVEKQIERMIGKQISEKKTEEQNPSGSMASSAAPPIEKPHAAPVSKAAAAGLGGNSSSTRTPKLDASEQFITATAKASVDAMINEGATLSAAPVEAEPEAPRIAIDPLMAEPKKGAATTTRSFSEISELPPLKEVYVAPVTSAQPEVVEQPEIILKSQPVEKPKIQPREAAKKAVTEIKKTPPKLFGYSVLGAVVVILLVIAGIAWHIHSENSWDDSPTQSAQPVAPVAAPHPQPAPPVTAPAPVQVQPESQVQTAAPATAPDEAQTDVAPDTVSVRPKNNRRKNKSGAPVVAAGELTINSTPEGAAVSLDGQTDSSWVTPLSLTGIAPGQHTVVVSKSGYSQDTRTINVGAGGKSLVSMDMAQLSAGLAVSSTPAGAEVFVDGRDTGHATPAQIALAKPGNHTVLVKKQGFLDETATVNVQFGQTFRIAPTLKALGVTDDIKYKKRFGNKSNGMGEISVKTNPKGAQIAVNHRLLDKESPVEFYLNPGTYVVDITASGYKDFHRVIEVSEDGKVAIDENMEPQ